MCQGAVGLLWFVLWSFLVFDSPNTHPRISEEERLYITTSLKDEVMPETRPHVLIKKVSYVYGKGFSFIYIFLSLVYLRVVFYLEHFTQRESHNQKFPNRCFRSFFMLEPKTCQKYETLINTQNVIEMSAYSTDKL